MRPPFSWLLVPGLLMALWPATATSRDADANDGAATRRALFGELHLHTSLSFDADGFTEARTDPDLAYRFARGEAVEYLGRKVRRDRPLDFMAVTDHAEFMGFLNQLDDSDSVLSKSAFGRQYQDDRRSQRDLGAFSANLLRALANPVVSTELQAARAVHSAWQRTIDAANANYRPGTFTTFIGYEWTSHPESRYNLHRNVIFHGGTAPPPFTASDSLRPEDLWSYLEGNRARGVEALAIPHNGNASDGHMFAWVDSDGRAIDGEYARRRAANEPLNEIVQGKGQSETMPALSPSDEFAGFEVMDRLVPRLDLKGSPPGSYVRDALGRGLLIAQRTGTNPFKLGAVGGSDFHNGLSTSAENAFFMAFGFDPDVNPPEREQAEWLLKEPAATDVGVDPLLLGSSGLTGVWAERNDRDAIYAALRRRETFATSGTRLQLRLFAGWDYPAGLTRGVNWVRRAYAEGVAMGGDLPRRSQRAGAPRFVLWALKDPDGANLDRAQIVKVWIRDAQAHEKVFDVILGGEHRRDAATGRPLPVGNTVDVSRARYTNSIGATELLAEWRDPAFDADEPAVYYLRVLEIPTPRWSTILAARHGLAPPKRSPATLQERGWSSPIWYTPPK
ncbi:MAG: DUF3604 domain-containing protein [Gammaproteobacteria bacterium]|nr:DUF3604 domain-containing protein [Gammaproteobacteria bacterium]